MNYGDTYNGKNVFTELGFLIQHDREKLLSANDRKSVVSYDWVEQNGEVYHLSDVKRKDGEVSLRCVFSPEVENEAEFWKFHERFVYQISTPGWNKLYIADHDRTYKVFYLRMDNVDNKTKRIKRVNRLFIKFNLVLKVAPTYHHNWKRHAELFPEEYLIQWVNGKPLLEHKKPVSVKNKDAAILLVEKGYQVILPPHQYKPIATGSGIWEKQCDAIINGKPSEIYNISLSLDVRPIFRAIKACYKKEPYRIVVYVAQQQINLEEIESLVLKAIKMFQQYVGMPMWKELILLDSSGSIYKNKNTGDPLGTPATQI